jgi:hypothetical protein
MNLKVALVGVIAAVIVGIGAFGFGSLTQAEIQRDEDCDGQNATYGDLCIYTTIEHGIDTATTTTGIRDPSCPQATGAVAINTDNYPPIFNLSTTAASTTPLIVLGPGGTVLICVNAENGQGQLSIDTNDNGTVDRPACGPYSSGPGNAQGGDDGDERIAEWPDDQCFDPVGTGTDQMFIPDINASNNGPRDNDLETVIFRFNCGSFTGTTRVTVQQDSDTRYIAAFDITCRGEVTAITITATPNTVEIVPARSNSAHSLIDVDTGTVVTTAGRAVDFRTDRCAIESSNVDEPQEYTAMKLAANQLNTAIPASYAQFNWLANHYFADDNTPVADFTNLVVIDSLATFSSGNPQVETVTGFDVNQFTGIAAAGTRTHAATILHCDPHGGVTTATPGVATISVCWEVVGGTDICGSVTVTVIGPPASITVAASPTSLRCGEKATITATVKDAIGQNVSDHTRVELVTNLGGTLGGQGAVAGFAGPVVPISSSVGDTFGGVSTAFLITSEVTSGPYEVVATSGGTSAGDWTDYDFTWSGSIIDGGSIWDGILFGSHGVATTLGGIFSTPPVSAQVTVTCTIPAAVVVAPTVAPTITAPRTGQGITPPNTGDAGLADASGASWVLFAIGGIAALSLVGFATAKAARR